MHFRTICAIHAVGIFGGGAAQNSLLIASLLVIAVLVLAGLMYVGFAVLRRSHGKMGRGYKKATPSLNCSTESPGLSPYPQLLQYDAFISYSKGDEPMVLSTLCR